MELILFQSNERATGVLVAFECYVSLSVSRTHVCYTYLIDFTLVLEIGGK